MSPLDTAQKDDTAATMIVSLSGSCCRIVVGSNLATLLALTLSVALVVSMGYRAATRALARPGAPAAGPGDPAPIAIGPASAG